MLVDEKGERESGGVPLLCATSSFHIDFIIHRSICMLLEV
jgi:hypothetical protein